MRRVCLVENERLRESLAVLNRELLRGSLEASGPLEDHRFKSATRAFAKHCRGFMQTSKDRRPEACGTGGMFVAGGIVPGDKGLPITFATPRSASWRNRYEPSAHGRVITSTAV
jgi:hypothetical protein